MPRHEPEVELANFKAEYWREAARPQPNHLRMTAIIIAIRRLEQENA